MNVEDTVISCSFCGKSQHEVHTIVAGPAVFICDECIELCVDICFERKKQTDPESLSPLDSARLLIETQKSLLGKAQALLMRDVQERKRWTDPLEELIGKIQAVNTPPQPAEPEGPAEILDFKNPVQE